MDSLPADLDIAVLIPCYNEAIAIGAVVAGFRRALPSATIYVYDNNSSDRTAQVAAAAGARVRHEHRQGKGHVVRRMFADVDADVFVLVDGDGTYDPEAAPALVRTLIDQHLDMVNARRVSNLAEAYRTGHVMGNAMLTGLVGLFFGRSFDDVLSGYRVFSRRFVKSFPALSRGFEIETELTVHALELRLPVTEVTSNYVDRAAGSSSKLRTYHDGMRILRTIAELVKEDRPMLFFGTISVLLALSATGLAIPILATFLETGLVPRFPTAILATGLMLSGLLSLVCGLVLDTVTRGRNEAKRIAYLAQSWLRPTTRLAESQVSAPDLAVGRSAPPPTQSLVGSEAALGD